MSAAVNLMERNGAEQMEGAMRKVIWLGLMIATCLVTSGGYRLEAARQGVPSMEGPWSLHANGYRFIASIEQRDGALTGTLTPDNHTGPTTTIAGQINGEGRVTFDRGEQRFRGRVFSGIQSGRHMAGVFSNTPQGTELFGWYAERR